MFVSLWPIYQSKLDLEFGAKKIHKSNVESSKLSPPWEIGIGTIQGWGNITKNKSYSESVNTT